MQVKMFGRYYGTEQSFAMSNRDGNEEESESKTYSQDGLRI